MIGIRISEKAENGVRLFADVFHCWHNKAIEAIIILVPVCHVLHSCYYKVVLFSCIDHSLNITVAGIFRQKKNICTNVAHQFFVKDIYFFGTERYYSNFPLIPFQRNVNSSVENQCCIFIENFFFQFIIFRLIEIRSNVSLINRIPGCESLIVFRN
ncbi:hypothetical protein SDC9_195470 [bioreactor metagenome]|uniref:Uncharacterized protein n=1 Tax=bioreactor metagenome TaxID=1076179 RepID=A0A645IAD6_9ZZZZ